MSKPIYATSTRKLLRQAQAALRADRTARAELLMSEVRARLDDIQPSLKQAFVARGHLFDAYVQGGRDAQLALYAAMAPGLRHVVLDINHGIVRSERRA